MRTKADDRGVVRKRMERGCVLPASPIWTAQLTACGSLIMYVTKIIPAPPLVPTIRQNIRVRYATIVHARFFAPLHLKKIGREFTHRRTNPIERSKRDSVGVSVRLIEWPAYRTISSLANNNGHVQHATMLYSSNERTTGKFGAIHNSRSSPFRLHARTVYFGL